MVTEAGWTREKPTKNGWYWWRFDASTSATIVRIMVCGDGSLAEVSNNGHLLLAANFDGEWLGPITPDSYQQGRAAGLQEARDIVNAGDAKTGRGGLIGQRIKQLAQQAQEEKGVGE